MIADFWYKLGRVAARIMLPTFGRVEITGVENVPLTGAVVVAANHQSNADPALMVLAMRRPLWFMAKRGIFRSFPVSYLLRKLHAFPVDRDGRDVDAVRWALEQLKQDRMVLIFPEATRRPGGLGKGTDGLTYLAARSRATIVPVGITGTERIKGFGRVAFPFCHMQVRIGEPFHLRAIDGRIPHEALSAMTDTVMERIAVLLPPKYRGVYADRVTTPAP
jgi:1-acyl-sn-glycerol-3-phosphate acyltransferase